MTPRDPYVFIGDPPMPAFHPTPPATEVHVSCVFSWDKSKVQELALAWGQYYPVRIGGPAFESDADGFTPGLYVRQGVTFTSRGCNNQCPWCLVPRREGKLRTIEIRAGNIIQDNNLLQCNKQHIRKVFDMLRRQHAIEFTGGLDSRLVTDDIADDIRGLRVKQVFLAADTKQALKPLEVAIKRLGLPREKVRCYVLLGWNAEPISDAVERLHAVWELGAMPFAQLYQPPDKWVEYSKEWRSLARTWSRPAAMKARMRRE